MFRAITLDLDDTLWPVWPAIARAEALLHGWLREHAPATAARVDTGALRALREQIGREHPERGHDLSWLRQTSIERALAQAGDDPALGAAAFEVFFAERQRVELFAEVGEALATLARHLPILALTNGNADLQRIGLASHFCGNLTAREFGVGKPDARLFHEACRRLGHAPAQVLHVGDDWALDIEGAHAAGLPSVWLRREGHPPKPDNATAQPWRQLGALDELVRELGLV
ncbi:MAG TPA: HAD-IA family hydrolase [Ideonella sp.]|nr:HAD-IA family hydrolase [Ideonella sp.]